MGRVKVVGEMRCESGLMGWDGMGLDWKSVG